jgi:DeoR/GlpR family transcriptional regulator of sugar metabolism
MTQTQVQQRREQLLKLLQADTFASVESLSDRLRVSTLTVRRDLDALQEIGLVERMHGGARSIARSRAMDQSEISFYSRRESRVIEKQAIAQAAVDLLVRDAVVMVDASTSGLYFARAIPESFPLTLITYSAFLPVELASRSNLEVISTGGVLHRKSLCYVGEDAERALAPFHARMAFFGSKGVSIDAGCTDALLAEIRLKEALVRRVDELVILADHTKLGNIGLAAFAPLEGVHTLITDSWADAGLVQSIRERGVEVILALIPDSNEVV